MTQVSMFNDSLTGTSMHCNLIYEAQPELPKDEWTSVSVTVHVQERQS